jgi:hypothetical protein
MPNRVVNMLLTLLMAMLTAAVALAVVLDVSVYPIEIVAMSGYAVTLPLPVTVIWLFPQQDEPIKRELKFGVPELDVSSKAA